MSRKGLCSIFIRFLNHILVLLSATVFLHLPGPVTVNAVPYALPVPAPTNNPNGIEGAVVYPGPPPGASPIPDNPLKNINKDWFRSYLWDDQPPNTAVFYCKMTKPAQRWAVQESKDKKIDPLLRTIWESYPADFFKDQQYPRKYFTDADNELTNQKEDGEEVWDNRNRYSAMSSEAFAEKARGDKVYLVLDDQKLIPPQCIWLSEEKTALQRGSVTKVEKVVVKLENRDAPHGGEIKEEVSRNVYDIGAPELCYQPPPGRKGRRDAPYCGVSFSSTAAPTTTGAPSNTAGDPLCTPSEGAQQACICSTSGGYLTLPMASSTGSNTGEAYNPCPMTTLPPASTSMSPTPTPTPTLTNPPDYPYTYTDYMNHGVFACQSSSLYYVAGVTETMCAGSSVIVRPPPPTASVSVEVGKGKQNVGTLTGTALYTSISSALNKICPTATGSSSCSTDEVAIYGVDYVGDDIDHEHSVGELVVKVESSSYNLTSIRDAMIKSAAQTAQSTANSTNCKKTEYNLIERPGEPPTKKSITLCNAAGFAGVQYHDGVQENAAMWIDAMWNFATPGNAAAEEGDFECEAAVEGLDAALLAIAPEFAIGELEIGEEITAACMEALDES